jgi:hypothetical protein
MPSPRCAIVSNLKITDPVLLMSPQSLHALIVDRHAGELSPEAVELLDLHLTQNPDARVEVERVMQALNATRDAVLWHPEMARVIPPDRPVVSAPRRPTVVPWLAWAAAAVVLAALTGAGGFIAGRSQSPPVVVNQTSAPMVAVAQAAPRKQSPWAQYRMTFDPAGDGMQVVRVDSANLENKALR